MKRFGFFLTALIIVILMLLCGLIKNKIPSSQIGEGYVISESKNQSFSIVQSSDNVFVLKGQVADGTHNKIMLKTVDKNSGETITEDPFVITADPFERELTLPEDKESLYINLYYNEGMGLAICVNAINVINDNGKWKIAENSNTEANKSILESGSKRSFLYSDSELKELPTGLLTLSDTITKAHTNDYDKAYAIYIWLCEHIYITDDLQDKTLGYSYNTRIVDKDTYPELYAAMLRVQGIPCAVAECDNGYKFNVVYVKDKWINVQIDRDTFNKYTSHQYIYDRKNLYTHFGVPTDIISANYVVNSIKK